MQNRENMEKKLVDYLHLYMGCKCRDTFNDCDVVLTPKIYAGYMEQWNSPEDEQIRPYLRPLSDMTEDETQELGCFVSTLSPGYIRDALIHKTSYKLQIEESFELTAYLLSKGFDLFGLIESNLAIKQ